VNTPPDNVTAKRYLPWLVATALFMEQLDTTIVNTGIPSMAHSLGVTPLSLKAVVTSYILSLAVSIPLSGWLAERLGSRRVFLWALAVFTLSSLLCALAPSAEVLIASRIPQGVAAAMMMPVGRMAIVRTFGKAELLRAMNFVIVPALLGPLLGPTVGGLIVHWASWRMLFLVNLPVGLLGLWFAHRHMPDYYGQQPRRFDCLGWVLFGGGTALLSWLLEVFGEQHLSTGQALSVLALALGLLGAYGLHARRQGEAALLRLRLLSIRTFRVSVLGGFITRLGIGGLPLLLPLLYQIGMGLPAWQSGLLMMPAAAAAMGMKVISTWLLRRLGYRRVLIVNTLVVAVALSLYAQVGPTTPLALIVALGLCTGLFNSLQYSSMNSMAYADIDEADTAMASTLASTLQQLSMSFGLAAGSLTTHYFLAGRAQSDPAAVREALHLTFWALALWTALSSASFWSLRPNDGEAVSRGS
jgi:EmrB/QacA subfamily drug resistance transporter